MTKHFAAPAPAGYRSPLMRTTITTEGGHFSVTASIGQEAVGCMHDEVLASHPFLKPFVDLHLSDAITGEPMHAQANGFYWLAKAAGIDMRWGPDQDAETCFEYFLNHCRIDAEKGQAIVDLVAEAYDEGKKEVALSEVVAKRTQQHQHENGANKARKVWRDQVIATEPRWKLEAEKAQNLLKKLIEEA